MSSNTPGMMKPLRSALRLSALAAIGSFLSSAAFAANVLALDFDGDASALPAVESFSSSAAGKATHGLDLFGALRPVVGKIDCGAMQSSSAKVKEGGTAENPKPAAKLQRSR